MGSWGFIYPARVDRLECGSGEQTGAVNLKTSSGLAVVDGPVGPAAGRMVNGGVHTTTRPTLPSAITL